MRQVLEADDPLAAVMPVAREPALSDVCISASQFFFTALACIQAEQEPHFISSEPLVVPLIAGIDGGWSVLLTGFGIAWVQGSNSHVVKMIKKKPHASCHQLKVSCDLVPLQSIDGTVALFSLIGDCVDAIGFQLSTLSIGRFETDSGSWLKKILVACPRLKEIELGDVGVSNLSLFADTVNVPRIRRLVITGRIDVTLNINNVGRFLEALAKRSHPLTRSLQDLVLHVELSIDQCEPFFDRMRIMIHRNRRLQAIRLNVKAFDGDALDEIETATNAIVDDPGLCVFPLNLASKLAFLSVVFQDTGIVREVLDSGVIANVFDFAAGFSTRGFDYISGD